MKLPIRKTGITFVLLSSLALAPAAPSQTDTDSMFLDFEGMIETVKAGFRDLKMWLETRFERATDTVDAGMDEAREKVGKAADWSKEKIEEEMEAYEKKQSE